MKELRKRVYRVEGGFCLVLSAAQGFYDLSDPVTVTRWFVRSDSLSSYLQLKDDQFVCFFTLSLNH